MALIVAESWDGLPEHYHYYDSPRDVQEEFCRVMEWGEAEAFFQNPEVKGYLEDFGVHYKGNYTLESKDWDEEKFMTFLNYPLQLACLALYEMRANIVVGKWCDYDLAKWLLPVLKKRDIYVRGDYGDCVCYADVAEKGVEVRIAGRSSKEMSGKEFRWFLTDLERRVHYLSRELDAEVFPEDYREKYLFEPTQTTLADYLRDCGAPDEDVARAPDVRVLVNGKNNFTNTFRKYPIYGLFYMEGEWRYANWMSVKYPTLAELLEDAVFCDEVMDMNGDILRQGRTDVSAAEKVFALVLDCDEICDARRYWETVAFVAKYDRADGVLEICDINRGVLEFHELLQQSGDLNRKTKEE